jgi:hypothetical protein
VGEDRCAMAGRAHLLRLLAGGVSPLAHDVISARILAVLQTRADAAGQRGDSHSSKP